MSAMEEEIITSFENMNITIDEKILAKCLELCTLYDFDAESLVDQWLAYTASNLNGDPPTLDALETMERKELKKQGRNITTRKEIIHTTPVRVSYAEPMEVTLTPSASQPLLEASILNTPSQTFSERTNSLSVRCEFGAFANSFQSKYGGVLSVEVLNEAIDKCKYMYQTCLSKRDAINAMTIYVTRDIADCHGVELSQKKMQDYAGEMVIWGRVYASNTGKLKNQSIVLEGTIEINGGRRINLGVGNVDKFHLFNGQSVIVKGNNIKNYFIAKEILTEAHLPPPQKPISLTENIQIIVAAGPFTLPENILYEPLEELLKYVIECKPNVLILMGPFIERERCNIMLFSESCDTFFEKIVDGIMERLKGTGVQVILVPSHKDFHNHIIFPTPPYQIRKRYDNLILAPDPMMLDIEGLIIGGGSADVLFHLNRSEFYNTSIQSDKLSRLISHLINQRSFYPIYPPSEGIRVDYCLLEKFGTLDYVPHLMILPSIFQHFVKVVSDCVIINPEKITKGQTAGTFAKIEVRSGDEPVAKRVTCQILRL